MFVINLIDARYLVEFEIMKAETAIFDAHYEVYFLRPTFSRITSFAQVIEPIYDAFSPEILIPSDAIKLENGNSIDTARVTLNLFSGYSQFEAKLDGYKAHFFDLRSPQAIDQAKRHAVQFETVILEFLADADPGDYGIITQSWLTLDGGASVADALVRRLTWLPESHDPFQIGANYTRSQVKFKCSSTDEQWSIGITVDRSALPEAHLCLEMTSEYETGSQFDSFDKKTDHLYTVARTVIDQGKFILFC